MTDPRNLTRMAGAGLRAAWRPTFRDAFPLVGEGPNIVDPAAVYAHYLAPPNIGGGTFTDDGKLGKERRRFLELIPDPLHLEYEGARADERFVQLVLYVKNRGNGEGDEGILLGVTTDKKHYVIAVWNKKGHDKWDRVSWT